MAGMLRAFCVVVAATGILAGCQDEVTPSGTPSTSVSSAVSTPAVSSPAVSTPAVSTSPTAPGVCAPQPPYTVKIVSGAVTCEDAYGVVGQYDFQGDKRQEIDGFVCETGTAQTRPIVLTCTSPDAEFTVSE